jgi:hypothetical protein
VALQKRKSILDVEDVVKIPFTSVITKCASCGFPEAKRRNILGLNGIH